jgi:tetratricopeptide (TPR) repeat protein
MTRAPFAVGVALAALLTHPAAAQTPHEHQAAAAADTVPLFDDLGSHHYPISSQVPLVQEYFDQGLRLYYAFNHAEAIRAFEEAARRDPTCAICHWGVAKAYGPNINAPMGEEQAREAWAALQRAREHEHHASEKERALIAALGARYVETPTEDRAALDSAYARAMAELAERYPDDLELQVLHAEAVMDLSPGTTGRRRARRARARAS